LAVRAKRLPKAVRLLARAAELAPEHARHAYVFALARRADGDRSGALDTLETAMERRPNDSDMINWHRLFGLTLDDYFTGTGYAVELEKDLARKRQLLDVLVIREPEGGAVRALADPCDGLEALRPHNLLTYKSLHESLDAWAIEELIGHYVNYRKAFAPTDPPDAFALFAVATRHPRALFAQVAPTAVKPGIFRLDAIGRPITVVVPREVERAPRNALWELFSAEAERVAEGARNFRWQAADHLPILTELYQRYQDSGLAMSYTIEDFHRDIALKMLPQLPPEERLRGLPPEERLRGLPPEERLRGGPREHGKASAGQKTAGGYQAQGDVGAFADGFAGHSLRSILELTAGWMCGRDTLLGRLSGIVSIPAACSAIPAERPCGEYEAGEYDPKHPGPSGAIAAFPGACRAGVALQQRCF
jgi:tetratricopeptide (TPR) repeat protein